MGPRARAACVCALALLLFEGGAGAEDRLSAPAPRIKAAILRNFTRYVTWPASAFEGPTAPWCVGVLGPDPFGEVLDKTLGGRTEQGRGFRVVRAERLDQLGPCQIVYVTLEDARQRRDALTQLARTPTLTVGDAPDFLSEGGVIQFHVAEHVAMSVNLDVAHASSLKIHTAMLEVSKSILEHGLLRAWR